MITYKDKFLSTAVVAVTLCLSISCGDPGAPRSRNSIDGLSLNAGSEFERGIRARIMRPVDKPAEVALPIAQLHYYGGRVISNVNVVVVFWGPNVNSIVRSRIGAFYTAINDSEYFDWLTEYNTFIPGMDGLPGSDQAIGRGTFAQTVTISPGSATTIPDSMIQTQLDNDIESGVLPAPDDNALYMVYFPPGRTITLGVYRSCRDFCAYHGTFVRNGASVPYGVIPDLSCSGCGIMSQFNNTTLASSHEMIEAVTDMEAGLTEVIGRPLAWYNQANGEIGDFCNWQAGTIRGFTVQKEWSNLERGCILSRRVANDFSITLDPTSQIAAPGATVEYTVNTALRSGSPQTINLDMLALPKEITPTFSPSTITVGESSILTLTVSESASLGRRNFVVSGEGTSVSRFASGSISVE